MTKDIKEMDTAVFQPCIAASCWRVWRLMLPQIMYDVLGLLVGPNELATCCSKCADLEDFQVSPFTATCFVGARKTAMHGENFFQLTLNRQEICGKACGRHGSWWSYNLRQQSWMHSLRVFYNFCKSAVFFCGASVLGGLRGLPAKPFAGWCSWDANSQQAPEMSFVDISGALVRIGVEGAV